MNVVNTHARVLTRPLPEVFDDLVALGTAADRIWPEPKIPFMEGLLDRMADDPAPMAR